MNNTRNIVIGIIVLVVVVLIGYNMYNSGNQNTQQQASQNQDATNQQQATTSDQTTTTGTTNSARLTYTKAVDVYKNRFQFSGCHANPGTISVKKGVPVMLDNRDATAHTIKANGQTFKIAGYDYAVVYPAIATVGSVSVDSSNVTCDGGGSATLNVEK